MNTQLDSFETALLTELRAHVSDRGRVRRLPGRRIGIGVAVAGAAAAAVIATSAGPLAPGGPDLAPAVFEVAKQADGDVVVTVRSLDQSDALERALQRQGVDADIMYDPDAATSIDTLLEMSDVPEGHTLVRVECQPLFFERTSDGFTFTIRAVDVRPDRKLLLTTTGTAGDWAIAFTRWEGVC